MRTRPSHQSCAFRSDQAIIRFLLRMIVLLAFAAIAGIGFAPGLTMLLWMSAALSAAVATFKRELPLADALNHWDEAAAYIALCCLIESISRATA